MCYDVNMIKYPYSVLCIRDKSHIQEIYTMEDFIMNSRNDESYFIGNESSLTSTRNMGRLLLYSSGYVGSLDWANKTLSTYEKYHMLEGYDILFILEYTYDASLNQNVWINLTLQRIQKSIEELMSLKDH